MLWFLRIFPLLILLALQSACDRCKRLDCGSRGSCDKGVCTCNTGYEADAEGRCELLQRDKFLGMYSGSDQCSGSTETYFCTLSEDADPLRLRLSNLYGLADNEVYALVQGSDLQIPAQTTAAGFSIEGSGTLTGNLLQIQYTIVRLSDNASDQCQLQLQKQ